MVFLTFADAKLKFLKIIRIYSFRVLCVVVNEILTIVIIIIIIMKVIYIYIKYYAKSV